MLALSEYQGFMDKDDSIAIPADIIFDLIENNAGLKEEALDRYLTDEYIDNDMKRGFVDDLGLKLQPEVWTMNSTDFKKYLCEILELNYHTSARDILQVIGERLEGRL